MNFKYFKAAALTGLILICRPLFSQSGQKPVTLYRGMGVWTHPIATSNPEAQKYFDQGLALLYGFNRYEALRSFRKSAELDPHAAMPYWGIAMSFGPYINMGMDASYDIKQSCAAVQQGLGSSGITPADRAWLEAAGKRCPAFADPVPYIDAMRALAIQLPDDPDAQTLYAEALLVRGRWSWYDIKGHAAAGVPEAEHLLEEVLRRYPTHAGANHLYIHAVESSPSPERAIPSAERLMGIVPGLGHLVHMPGHIWLVLGQYGYAADINERAVQVDRQYFQDTGVMGSYYPYYLHNLSFVLYARVMQGRIAQSNEAARQLTAAIQPMAKMMPEMAGAFSAMVMQAKVRLCRWDEILNSAEPPAGDATARALWRYSRALALAGKGELPGAKKERTAFEAERKKLDRKAYWGNNKLGDAMDLAAAILDARIEESPERAVLQWRHAVQIQDTLVYDEPPAWYYPVRESLGAALYRAGKTSDAETVFREGLQRSPHNGRMLFGLRESLKAQQKNDSAGWVEREFGEAWNGADLTLRMEDL